MIQLLKNKPIIINTDLDGIISGLILSKYLNCRIVGFSNSAEKIWLEEPLAHDYKKACFVDMYVANPDTMTIDQHIVSVNAEHHNILIQNQNKINPNLLNKRCFLPNQSYYMKYPFGTIHFIIALLEEVGIKLTDLNLYNTIQNLSFIDLILRSDDAMNTTVNSNYMINASEWWNWLEEKSNHGSITSELKTYLSNITAQYAVLKKNEIAFILQNHPFNCNTPDGGIHNVLDESQLKQSVKNYIRFIADVAGIELFDINKNFKAYLGSAKRTSLTEKQQNELTISNTIDGQEVFSYAFVRSSNRDNNFSYTLKNKDNI
jgi:hypothetical protein